LNDHFGKIIPVTPKGMGMKISLLPLLFFRIGVARNQEGEK